MDEDKLNMEIRKFLKEVGVTSQRESTTLTRRGYRFDPTRAARRGSLGTTS
jgi:DNA-binding winged helix-turn-helix (wHTH) protein